MSSPLRSCEEDEGMVVNSEGGDFDEEDDEGDQDASDINSPAAPRETATPAAPGTVKKTGSGARKPNTKHTYKAVTFGRKGQWKKSAVCGSLYLLLRVHCVVQ